MTELFLLARIAGRGVAIESGQVVSVVDIGEVVPVPGASTAVRGLAALRSRVVTVVDAALALGLESHDGEGSRPAIVDDWRVSRPVGRSCANATRAVIVKVDGHEYALLVEALEDVAPFQRLPLSSGLALDRGWAHAGVGLVERDGEPLLVIDVAALVPAMANAA